MSRTALVTGSGSGLGRAIAIALVARADFDHVYPYDHNVGLDVSRHSPEYPFPDKLDLLVNCAGVNRIGYLEDFSEEDWDLVMDTNAKGIFKMTQACLPALAARQGTILNIVSNAAHTPMTGSLAYNASKAAAHIMTLQLARELMPRHGITVFGIAPNKLAGTGMSRYIEEQVPKQRGWTPEEARAYQLKALPAGEETSVETLANFIAYLLFSKDRHKYLHGTVLPYGG